MLEQSHVGLQRGRTVSQNIRNFILTPLVLSDRTSLNKVNHWCRTWAFLILIWTTMTWAAHWNGAHHKTTLRCEAVNRFQSNLVPFLWLGNTHSFRSFLIRHVFVVRHILATCDLLSGHTLRRLHGGGTCRWLYGERLRGWEDLVAVHSRDQAEANTYSLDLATLNETSNSQVKPGRSWQYQSTVLHNPVDSLLGHDHGGFDCILIARCSKES